MKLAGRVVLITGAAGGIGRALAKACAARGAALALVDLDRERLEQVRASLPDTCPKVSLHVADVADTDALARVRDELLAAHGRLHVLINNAGMTVYGLFEQHEPEEIERIVAVNFLAVLGGCQVFLPLLRREPRAAIVNVSSMAGLAGFPLQTLYCATKFAVRGFSESLRAELSGTGIGVTCVLPGATRSGILAAAKSRDPELTGQLSRLLERHGGSPDKLARRVVWALRWDRAEVRGAIDSHLLDLGKRLAPGLLRWTMRLVMRVAVRRSKAAAGR